MFDLTLTPLHFINGKEQPGLPGFYGAAAPRRCARGRAGEQAILFLSLQGAAQLGPHAERQLLERLAQSYFQTAGPVTSAMRAAIDSLNGFLLERNLKATGGGRQTVGLFSMGILHGSQLYLANCGPTHVYLLAPTLVQHFHEPTLAGRGLGLSRTAGARYYQVEVAAGQYLAVTPEPPGTWSASSLAGSASLSLETLRRRLLNQSRPDVCIGLLSFQVGSGKIIAPEPLDEPKDLPETPQVGAPQVITNPAPDASGAADFPAQTDSSASTAPVLSDQAAGSTQAQAEEEQIEAQAAEPVTTHSERAQTRAERAREAYRRRRLSEETRADAPVIQEMKARKPRHAPAWLVSGWRAWRNFWRAFSAKSGAFFGKAARRVLPGLEENTPTLSPGTMIAIAVIVPLLVVGVALTVYYEKGLDQQYRLYLAEAQSQADQARALSDPAGLRAGWQQVLTALDKAEERRKHATNETRALRSEAYTNLDQLDGITRVVFQPAVIGELPAGTVVTSIINSGNDIFLLDANSGRVIRAELAANGYKVDSAFQCAPGPYGNLIVSKLVDMVAMPVNNELRAAIQAIDENGTLVYCLVSGPPVAIPLGAPDTNWGKISAFATDGSDLYILDPATNYLWVYAYKDGGYPERPNIFTAENAPVMSDVVDLTIKDQDIYLLHKDGHLTLCTISYVGGTPTRCTDPSPYSDPRPGRDPNPTSFPGATLTQIQYTDPPEPSIFLLDSSAVTIYHFSLRLNLHRLLRPQSGGAYPLPAREATAFSVSPNRAVFVALGDQVFYGFIP